MILRVGLIGWAMLALSCATSGVSSAEVQQARRAYGREHGTHCAIREERARRRAADQEQDREITYRIDRDDPYARAVSLQGAEKSVSDVLVPLREALRSCKVGDPDELGRWFATFSVAERSFSAHDPRTAACVSSVVGARLAGAALGNASAVVIALGVRDTGVPSLTKSAIGAVMDTRTAEVRACYEAALLGWPQLEGTLAAKFIIASDGRVQISAVAQSTLAHLGVECCIMNVIDGTRFPPVPNGGIVVVTYPYTLSPED